MGTSKSSTGPGAGVALVPPWAAPEGESDEDQPSAEPADPQDPTEQPETVKAPLAPPGRFRDARRQLGAFARTGDADSLRRGLGYYVRSGYGGSATFSRRLAAVGGTSGRLYNVLATGQLPNGAGLADVILVASSQADVVLDAVVNALQEPNGTQDAEATRKATRTALSDLLQRYPDADLLTLDTVQRLFAVERYSAEEIFLRVRLDLHDAIAANAADASTMLSRLSQIRSYIQQAVAAQFRALGTPPTTASQVKAVVTQVIKTTLTVFEEF